MILGPIEAEQYVRQRQRELLADAAHAGWGTRARKNRKTPVKVRSGRRRFQTIPRRLVTSLAKLFL